jgi:hypothetical protein
MLRNQCGHVKDDCLEALKWRDDDYQCYFILARSRLAVEQYGDCVKYIKQGLVKCPDSKKLHELNIKCSEALELELERVKQITTISEAKEDKRLEVYRNLRSKGVKMGKRLHQLPETVDMTITLDKRGKLHFPVLLLYEEFMTTDFI